MNTTTSPTASTQVSSRLGRRAAPVRSVDLVEDFCFSAESLLAIEATGKADEVLSHLYPQGEVVGAYSRD